jgi:hypothetical protein
MWENFFISSACLDVPDVGGWVNCFLVKVWIVDYVFEIKSISLAVGSVNPSSISSSFILGILGEHLVVGFRGEIFLHKML